VLLLQVACVAWILSILSLKKTNANYVKLKFFFFYGKQKKRIEVKKHRLYAHDIQTDIFLSVMYTRKPRRFGTLKNDFGVGVNVFNTASRNPRKMITTTMTATTQRKPPAATTKNPQRRKRRYTKRRRRRRAPKRRRRQPSLSSSSSSSLSSSHPRQNRRVRLKPTASAVTYWRIAHNATQHFPFSRMSARSIHASPDPDPDSNQNQQQKHHRLAQCGSNRKQSPRQRPQIPCAGPTTTVTTAVQSSERCPVCLECFIEAGDDRAKFYLKCFHQIHQKCWNEMRLRNLTKCPICRTPNVHPYVNTRCG